LQADSPTPPAGNDFVAIAAGGAHSLALKSDGSVVGWGNNWEGLAEGRMTGNGAKIWTGNEKSLVEVRRKNAKMLDFQRIGVSWGLPDRRIGRVDGQTC